MRLRLHAFGVQHRHGGQPIPLGLRGGDLADADAQPPIGTQRGHTRQQPRLGAELVAPVQQDHLGGLRQFGERGGAQQGGLVAADHEDPLAGEGRQIVRVVEDLPLLVRFQAGHLDAAGREGAHACRDEDAACQKLRSRTSADREAAVVQRTQRLHLVADMQAVPERGDLLEQALWSTRRMDLAEFTSWVNQALEGASFSPPLPELTDREFAVLAGSPPKVVGKPQDNVRKAIDAAILERQANRGN